MKSGKSSPFLLISLFLFFCHQIIIPQKSGNSDGPYLFYKNNEIVVKYIVPSIDSCRVSVEKYNNRSDIKLTCTIPVTGDKFTFKLHSYNRVEKSVYKNPGKMFVISDIEGNFAGLKQILIGAGVINNKLKWSFGKGHFVFNGDLFDRGINPTECLWFLYKLEKEAEAAGGKIHFILGNHEIMNLNNNPKYVNKSVMKNIPLLNEDYKDLFSANTELGRWLRTKNVIEKIGSVLFVHGGLSRQIDSLNLSLEQINNIARESIGKKKEELSNESEKIITSSKIGPYWYRGIAQKTMPENEIDSILKKYNAKKIVLGHSIFEDIQFLYRGKVLVIDLTHQENSEKGFMKGLYIQKDKFYIINENGVKKGIN